MNLINIASANLLHNRFKLLMSLLLLAFGTAVLLLVNRLEQSTQNQMQQNLGQVDMVVGAKGSPLQLILSAVYQVDHPTGNIPFEQSQRIAQNPMIRKAVPLAYGDNFQNFRIIGTDTSYINLYRGTLASGSFWQKSLEVVLGHEVAKTTGLQIGSTFLSSHGLDMEEGEEASQHQSRFTVSGILKETGSVPDRLILTGINSVWDVHHDHESEEKEKEITALLIQFKNPRMGFQLGRMINEGTVMQAALPAIELNRLRFLLESGSDVLQLVGLALLVLALLSLMVNLLQIFEDRKYELALLKAQGAPIQKLALLLFTENMLLVLPGWLLGELLARTGFVIMNQSLKNNFQFVVNPFQFNADDLWLLLVLSAIALLSALLPALKLRKLKVIEVLSRG